MTVTHGDRVVYPDSGHTKLDVVRYYERAAERILPHVAGRALTIKRYPKGVGGPGFFQKNLPSHYPASIGRLTVPRRGGDTTYPVVSEPEHLGYLANQGVIELHVPTALAAEPFLPDRYVIDLDPPPGAVALVRRAARIVGEELAAYGLSTALVATGSKGYHVVARLDAQVGADALGQAGQQLGAMWERAHPDTFTTTFTVAERGGKVFVDWMRNWPFATVVAPYGLRARARPTVAFPLGWDELDALDPDALDLDTVAARWERPDPVLGVPISKGAAFVAAVGAAFAETGLEVAPVDRFGRTHRAEPR